jgi:hypothetical protein
MRGRDAIDHTGDRHCGGGGAGMRANQSSGENGGDGSLSATDLHEVPTHKTAKAVAVRALWQPLRLASVANPQ